MSKDYLNMGDLHPVTAQDIRDYYESHEWEELGKLVQPEAAALMFFRLRKAPESIFTHSGRWAVVQHIESLIDQLDAIQT